MGDKPFSGFPEPQFTPTPNLIFDDFLRELSGSQLKVLLFIVRKTMGWAKTRKSFVPVSILDIQQGCNLSKDSVVDSVSYLHSNGYVMRKKQRDDSGHAAATLYRLRFEGDPDEEDEAENPRSEKSTLENPKVENPYVGFFVEKVDLGGPVSISVFKETEKETTPPTPPLEIPDWDPRELGKLLASKFKRLHGGKGGKQILEMIVGKLTLLVGSYTEQYILDEFDSYAKESFWESYDPRHRVNAFFAYLEGRDRGSFPSLKYPCVKAETGRQSISEPKVDPGILSAPTRAPIGFPEEWNRLVPERPVDPKLITERFAAYLDPGFQNHFAEICSKFRDLILRGADIGYIHLFNVLKSGIPWWKAALAGGLEWLAPRQGSRRDEMSAADKARMTRDLAEKMRQDNEARKKAAGQTAQ